jgi:RimJ/RimL family protein N-acetyltransferase
MTGKAFCQTAPEGASAVLAGKLQAIVPVLETERLVLRAIQLEDFDEFWAMLKDPGGHFFGDAKSFEDAWAEFLHLTGMWLLRGHGGWAVTLRATGDVVGFVQIGAEPGDMEPELGWILQQEARGKGIAAEAAKAAKSYAFGEGQVPSLVSYVDFENDPSRRLAERLGAFRDSDAEAALPTDDKCCVYRHVSEGVH